MDERRSRVRTGCAALLIWLAAVAVARAEPRSKEFWPEVDTWLRVSNAWRLSVFVPIAENLDTQYRGARPVLVSRYS
jgi:hypothetical protein